MGFQNTYLAWLFHSSWLDLVESNGTLSPSRLILSQDLEWLKWNVDPSFPLPLPNLEPYILGMYDSVYFQSQILYFFLNTYFRSQNYRERGIDRHLPSLGSLSKWPQEPVLVLAEAEAGVSSRSPK